LTCGITGLVANLLLVLDQLTEPFDETRQDFNWLPDAILGRWLGRGNRFT
jgi:hypothetical protein